MLIFSAILALELAISWNSFLRSVHDWAMYIQYLGYILLEAHREYVLHGPLLSIYWLRLCPHLGGPRPKPRRPEEIVCSLTDSFSHFTHCVFPLKVPQHTQRLSLTEHSTTIHTYYSSHLYARLHLYFIRLVHIFVSSELHGRLAALGFLCPIH
jgi:hypothetical protein